MVKQGKKAAGAGKTRIRKTTRRQARVKAKVEARQMAKLPGSFRISSESFKILVNHWRSLGGIVLIYLILNVIFASGISGLNSTVDTIKADLNNVGAHAHPLASGLGGFLSLVSSAGSSSSATGSALQTILIIMESLVIIWALRQLSAGKSFKVKDAYYNSMTPLVPFLLVIAVIIVQFIPISFGSALVAGLTSTPGLITGLWYVLLLGIFGILAAWSVYMVSASVFGLYIVTLPGMQPKSALRSARNLVRFRRWLVLRRVLFLPILLLVFSGAIIIPLILYATFLVTPVFYILSAIGILFVHTYLYNLYRGLLG